MSANLARERARYQGHADDARRAAALTLVPQLGIEFHVSGWSVKAREACADQWEYPPGAERHFDWEEIFRRHRDPNRLDLAIWAPNSRLAAVALGLTTNEAIEIRFFEGDPRTDCPLKAKRSLIVLECAANYAQLLGRKELRIQPISSALERLYCDKFGFSLETPRKAAHYCKKAV